MNHPAVRSPWLRLFVVAALYYAGARLGLRLAFPGSNASPVWPPAGLALAVLLLWGRAMWPAILVGAFAANLLWLRGLELPLPVALALAGAICAGNAAEAVLTEYGTRRWCGGQPLADPLAQTRFVAVAGLGGALAASVGALALAAGGLLPLSHVASVWWTWWLGDTAGLIIVTPFLLAWGRPNRHDWSGRGLELALLSALTLALSAWIFGVWPFVGGTLSPLAFLPLPFLVWSAFRFGPRGATAALVLVSGLAVWGTTHGSGPFQAKSLSESLLLLQTFMGVLAMTVLMLCAALAERERGATALRQANDQLETRVRERTAQLELAHRQTRDSYLRLQELEALRDQLRHMIFHDLRTPLDALNYLLQLLEADTLSESQRATVALGRQSGQTLSGIIGDLLDVHIMEGGTLRLNWQELQPAQVVETALSQVHLLTTYKGVALQSRVAPQLPVWHGDAQKLNRVLVNLLDNALRFTPEGGTITVTVTRGDAPETIEFVVRDTGTGIAPEAFERIFHRFGQVAPNPTDDPVSTGLGLTFCKMIVEAHGGSIRVESEVGRGSEFFVMLPLRAAPVALPAPM